MGKFPQTVECECGQVKFLASSKPIATAVCYCADCQAAAKRFVEIDGIKSFCEQDGGTPYVTLKDKNWNVVQGKHLLTPVKLHQNSPTVRYVTTCCHSPMFLKFKTGFWVSTYRTRYTSPPDLEWRNKTAARKSELPYSDNIPRYKGYPIRLFIRLLKARF